VSVLIDRQATAADAGGRKLDHAGVSSLRKQKVKIFDNVVIGKGRAERGRREGRAGRDVKNVG
jgi:hypothetical protein